MSVHVPFPLRYRPIFRKYSQRAQKVVRFDLIQYYERYIPRYKTRSVARSIKNWNRAAHFPLNSTHFSTLTHKSAVTVQRTGPVSCAAPPLVRPSKSPCQSLVSENWYNRGRHGIPAAREDARYLGAYVASLVSILRRSRPANGLRNAP